MRLLTAIGIILIATMANLWADVEKETLIAITQATDSQYKMMVVQTTKSAVTGDENETGEVESLSYPVVFADVNGNTAVKDITDKNGDVAVSVSLRITRTVEGTTAYYDIKHRNDDESLAITSGELKLK